MGVEAELREQLATLQRDYDRVVARLEAVAASSQIAVIRSGPRSGKSTHVIHESAYRGYIVCSSNREAVRLVQLADEMNLSIPFPLTFDELIQGQLHGRNCSPLHIDNADDLLRYLCTRVGATLGTVTLSE